MSANVADSCLLGTMLSLIVYCHTDYPYIVTRTTRDSKNEMSVVYGRAIGKYGGVLCI